jgi:hypothetical protein
MTEPRSRVRERADAERKRRITANECPRCGVAADSPAPCGSERRVSLCPMIAGTWRPWERT